MNSTLRTVNSADASGNPNGTYTIGELSREFDITLRSIRFYEDQGLLQPTRVGTTRIFSRRDRGRLALICRGKRLGFSLKVIKTFLDLYESGGQQTDQMRFLFEKAQERVKVLEQQRVDLEQTLRELREISAQITSQMGSKAASQG
jgi:DNA-binding transcriptional MerR regulator